MRKEKEAVENIREKGKINNRRKENIGQESYEAEKMNEKYRWE